MRPDQKLDEAIGVHERRRADNRADKHQDREDRAHADAERGDADKREGSSLREGSDGVNQVPAAGLE